MVGGLEPQHEKGVPAVGCHRQLRLARVQQTAVGGVKAGLRDRAHAVGRGREAGEAHARGAPLCRAGLNPDPCLCDDPEHTLRPGEHPVRGDPGTRARQAPGLPDADRCDRAHRLDEVLDMRPHGREVAAGACRDPSSEGRELEGLRKMAQREPRLPELPLERGAERSRLDPCGAGDIVDLEHAPELAEIQRERAVVARPGVGCDAAHDRRASAVGDHRHPLARAPLEDALDVALVTGPGHEVRRELEIAVEAANEVRIGLPERMAGARVGVICADRRERGGSADARGRQRDPLDRHGLPDLAERQTHVLGESDGRRPDVIDIGLLVLIAPAPVLSPASVHRQRVYSRGRSRHPHRSEPPFNSLVLCQRDPSSRTRHLRSSRGARGR